MKRNRTGRILRIEPPGEGDHRHRELYRFSQRRENLSPCIPACQDHGRLGRLSIEPVREAWKYAAPALQEGRRRRLDVPDPRDRGCAADVRLSADHVALDPERNGMAEGFMAMVRGQTFSTIIFFGATY